MLAMIKLFMASIVIFYRENAFAINVAKKSHALVSW